MMFLERVRNLHDDIVYRHLPETRELAPIVLSGAFLLALATMLATTLLSGTGTHWRSDPSARIAYPAPGAERRDSATFVRPTSSVRPTGARAAMADTTDSKAPMLIDFDPESGTVNASAGTIEVRGMAINIGNWLFD